ncbi:leucyl/phenylalanyl-tRNA--protein transferase [Pikeienuella sp. HZG-20]|uniref:leucyl/phenylalanyl-tRNA--protein transferase n=1 Tax=Paludibacillus litoralis TaxID=3133267 RepID=UPI0030EC0BD6
MSDRAAPLEVTPSLLLRAYAAGVFPMADSADSSEILWIEPDLRGVIPLDGFHASRSLLKTVRRGGHEVDVDRDFEAVIDHCAARSSTWINDEIRRLYIALHRMGYAHSVEVRREGALVGGLYGVKLGAAFFGESMFSTAPDASKIALVYLVARLKFGGFRLLDTQFVTEHLAQFGACAISRRRYRDLLDLAISTSADFDALPRDTPPHEVAQLSTQRSYR